MLEKGSLIDAVVIPRGLARVQKRIQKKWVAIAELLTHPLEKSRTPSHPDPRNFRYLFNCEAQQFPGRSKMPLACNAQFQFLMRQTRRFARLQKFFSTSRGIRSSFRADCVNLVSSSTGNDP